MARKPTPSTTGNQPRGKPGKGEARPASGGQQTPKGKPMGTGSPKNEIASGGKGGTGKGDAGEPKAPGTPKGTGTGSGG